MTRVRTQRQTIDINYFSATVSKALSLEPISSYLLKTLAWAILLELIMQLSPLYQTAHFTLKSLTPWLKQNYL